MSGTNVAAAAKCITDFCDSGKSAKSSYIFYILDHLERRCDKNFGFL